MEQSIDGRPNSRRMSWSLMLRRIPFGLILQADGGAFRSNRHWYNIEFKCGRAGYRDDRRIRIFNWRRNS
ncbi:DUF930 domain-containing protein [Rhizobium sp. SEMIA 4085]|uniref:DUF930 domain-containing protein n=1 Tax=Rhizobium gallicum TaxID=56730 RepID=UPI0009E2B61E|nr:DUF930 domain-containing protein [Rhizobium sp. SEMIA 4085]